MSAVERHGAETNGRHKPREEKRELGKPQMKSGEQRSPSRGTNDDLLRLRDKIPAAGGTDGGTRGRN